MRNGRSGERQNIRVKSLNDINIMYIKQMYIRVHSTHLFSLFPLKKVVNGQGTNPWELTWFCTECLF